MKIYIEKDESGKITVVDKWKNRGILADFRRNESIPMGFGLILNVGKIHFEKKFLLRLQNFFKSQKENKPTIKRTCMCDRDRGGARMTNCIRFGCMYPEESLITNQ